MKAKTLAISLQGDTFALLKVVENLTGKFKMNEKKIYLENIACNQSVKPTVVENIKQ